MAAEFKPFRCGLCKQIFTGKDSKGDITFRYPFILECKHSVCFSCVKSAHKSDQNLLCAKCKATTKLAKKSNRDVEHLLLPDLYTLGVITHLHKPPKWKTQLTPAGFIQTTNIQGPSIMAINSCTLMCQSCGSQATNSCEKCKISICGACLDKFHKGHRCTPLRLQKYRTDMQKPCDEHANESVEYFCCDDGKLLCRWCTINGTHSGHHSLPIMEKNLSCLDELKETLFKANKSVTCLKESEKTLEDAIPKHINDMSQLEMDVREYFHELHSLLLSRECDLVQQLKGAGNQSIEEIKALKEQVKEIAFKLSYLINDGKQLLKNNFTSINAVGLISELKETIAEPKVLVCLYNQSNEIRPILPILFKDSIMDLGSIELNIKPKFKLDLEPFAEADHEIVVEASCRKQEPLFIRKIASQDPSSSSLVTTVTKPHSTQNFIRANYISSIMESDQVIVTHITDPGLFYVQKLSHQNNYVLLSKSIQKWCKQHKTVPDPLVAGDICIALYEKKWYRAHVDGVFYLNTNCLNEKSKEHEKSSSDEESDTSDSSDDIDFNLTRVSHAKVTYIDFGNSSTIPITETRIMKKKFLNMPAQAHKCSLWEVEPSSPAEEWSAEATQQLYSYVNNKELTMRVMNKVAGVLEVDLIHPISREIEHDCPVSVREALIFLELAVFTSDHTELNIMSQYRGQPQIFLASEQLCVNTRLTVIVTNIETPSKFYVQLVNAASKYFSNLELEMEDYYSNYIGDALNVFVPLLGHPYVAIHENHYLRVEVKRLPGQAMVTAFAIDYGYTITIPYFNLRKIVDQFLRLPMQACCCCLADVKPFTNESWTDDAISSFKSMVIGQSLQMEVHKSIPKLGYVVSLICDNEVLSTRINNLIVKQGFARSIGSGSLELEEPVYETNLPLVLAVPDMTVTKQTKQKKLKKIPVLVKPSEVALLTYTKKAAASAQPSESYMEVQISHVENPGCFYLHFNADSKTLTNLMTLLYEAYLDSEECETVWRVGDQCAVLENVSKKWHRGTLTEQVDDETFLVFFMDFGFTHIQHIKYLRFLVNDAKDLKHFAVKSHLEGINPAGHNSKWSGIACEEFELLVKEKVVYLHNEELERSEHTLESLPVQLRDKLVIPGGALDADRVEYRSINNYLVQLGVALPDRGFMRSVKKKKSVEESVVPVVPLAVKEQVELVKMFMPLPKTTWKSYPLPSWKNAVVIPTNVGHDGCIYLQTKDEMVQVVNKICAALQLALATGKYYPPTEVLREGQICTALYEPDKKWYRARITKVFPSKVEVMFVDYGNVEQVTLECVRAQIAFLDIPIQCIECELHNVRPKTLNGQWTTEVLNDVHKTIVDQLCIALIEEPPSEEKRVQISLSLPGSVSLVDVLVHRNVVKRIRSTDSDFIPFAKSNLLDQYPIISLPNLNVKFPVAVSTVLKCDIVCLQRMSIDFPCTDDDFKNNLEFERFLEMVDRIAELAPMSPVIETFVPEQLCCAEYSFDQKWYRCIISEVTESRVTVIYTDYGNSEDIPKSSERIRELPEELYEYPRQGVVCKFHNLSPAQPEWSEHIKEWSEHTKTELIKILMENVTKPMFAEVKVKAKVPEIDLFFKDENGKYTLAYQQVINEGLLTKY